MSLSKNVMDVMSSSPAGMGAVLEPSVRPCARPAFPGPVASSIPLAGSRPGSPNHARSRARALGTSLGPVVVSLVLFPLLVPAPARAAAGGTEEALSPPPVATERSENPTSTAPAQVVDSKSGATSISAETAGAEFSSEERAAEVRSFELIRETMEARYPYPERLEGSWAVRADSLRSALDEAGSLAESQAILRMLAHSMGESHFGVIPARAYGEIYEPDAKDDGGEQAEDGSVTAEDDSVTAEDDSVTAEDDLVTAEGAVGLDLRWNEGALVVVRLHEESGAGAVGIRPGDEVLSIDGRGTGELAAIVARDPSESVSRFETSIAIAGQRRLQGDLGEEVELEVCRQPGDTLVFSLPIEPWRGTPTKLGALPEQTVRTYSQDLGDIGVFGFSFFLGPTTVMPFVQSCFERFHDRRGIIIDLRGNFGGLMPMIQGIVGWLVDEPTQLGRMTMRGVDLELFANPRPPRFTGKVAVLTDELSISAAELFTAGVQEAGLARVFGARTAGLALPANVLRLPNGDGFMFVVADYTTPNGVRLERTGVVPDVEVPFTRFQLYEEEDPVLQAAADWIRE